jgi:hypothetical protein
MFAGQSEQEETMLSHLLKASPFLLIIAAIVVGIKFGGRNNHETELLDPQLVGSQALTKDYADRVQLHASSSKVQSKLVGKYAQFVRKIFTNQPVQTSDWYIDSARILVYSPKLEDKVLAHDFAALSLADGDSQAFRIYMESENAILAQLGHPVSSVPPMLGRWGRGKPRPMLPIPAAPRNPRQMVAMTPQPMPVAGPAKFPVPAARPAKMLPMPTLAPSPMPLPRPGFTAGSTAP